MRDSQMTQGLTMRWVPVVDESGRTHMEARWTARPSLHAPVHATHAA
jgi:hypothetical protein